MDAFWLLTCWDNEPAKISNEVFVFSGPLLDVSTSYIISIVKLVYILNSLNK